MSLLALPGARAILYMGRRFCDGREPAAGFFRYSRR